MITNHLSKADNIIVSKVVYVVSKLSMVVDGMVGGRYNIYTKDL